MAEQQENKAVEVDLEQGQPQPPPADALDELQRQFDQFKQRAEQDKMAAQEAATAAQREAAQAKQQVREAGGSLREQQLATLSQGIAAAEQDAAAAEQEWAQAMAAQDHVAAARAQRRLWRGEQNLQRLEDARAELEARAQQPPEPQQPLDPAEAFAQRATVRTAQWARAHPEYFRDAYKNAEAVLADKAARDAGHAADTDGYFQFVEERLGLRQPQQPNEAKRSERSEPLVAPAAAAARGGIVQRDRVVLTPGEQEAATDGTHTWNYDDPKGKFRKGEPIGVHEFARRKALLTKQGAYNRSFTDE